MGLRHLSDCLFAADHFNYTFLIVNDALVSPEMADFHEGGLLQILCASVPRHAEEVLDTRQFCPKGEPIEIISDGVYNRALTKLLISSVVPLRDTAAFAKSNEQ